MPGIPLVVSVTLSIVHIPINDRCRNMHVFRQTSTFRRGARCLSEIALAYTKLRLKCQLRPAEVCRPFKRSVRTSVSYRETRPPSSQIRGYKSRARLPSLSLSPLLAWSDERIFSFGRASPENLLSNFVGEQLPPSLQFSDNVTSFSRVRVLFSARVRIHSPRSRNTIVLASPAKILVNSPCRTRTRERAFSSRNKFSRRISRAGAPT